MASDFNLGSYLDLCHTIVSKQQDCRFIHYLGNKSESRIILRHDVDRRPNNSLRIAKMEYQLGLKSTYYFRCVPASFDENIIRKISEMNHEIGYHYEVMSKARGDIQKARSIFESDLEKLRSICEIRTVCMHGSPGSSFNNLHFWNHFMPKQFDIEGSAYLDASNVSAYFTDTGGKWNSDLNLRDKLPGCVMYKIKNTNELINTIKIQKLPLIYITNHPERWASTRLEGIRYKAFDVSCNALKKVIKVIN